MIDINELRRLAQAATPGPWWVNQDGLNHGFERGVLEINANAWHALAGAWAINGAKPSEEGAANAAYIAAANPAAISELLNRLEAAEKEREIDEQRIADLMAELNRVGHENECLRSRLEAAEKAVAEAYQRGYATGQEEIEAERDALRTKIEAMEKQEPVAWMLNCPTLGGDTGWILSWTQSGAGLCNRLSGEENERKLYALPGAQPTPSVLDGWIERGIAELEKIRDEEGLCSDRVLMERLILAFLAATPKPEGAA